MQVVKHNAQSTPPTEHVGLVEEQELGASIGGHIGARFRSIWRMFGEQRKWVIQRCNTYRVEDPRWSGPAVPGVFTPLSFNKRIIEGNRLRNSDLAFVCNRSGIYHLSAFWAAETKALTVADPRLAVLVNGAWYSWLDIRAGVLTNWALSGSDHVPLCCGDVLQVGWWYDAGGTASSLSWSGLAASYGYVGAHWECDACIDSTITNVSQTVPNAFGTLFGV